MFPAYAPGGGRDSAASSEYSTPGGGSRNSSFGGGNGYAPSNSSNGYTPSPNGFSKGKKQKRKQWVPDAGYQQRQAQIQQQQQERAQAESVASIRPDEEPEDIKPEIEGLGFRNDSFQKATYASYDNTRKVLEEKERKAKERKRAEFEIKKRQEGSIYAVKVVNIVDSDLDSEDDVMAVHPIDDHMASTSGAIKRNRSSSSSGSSSESDDEGLRSRKSHKHKKSKKKKGKKHRGSSSDSGPDGRRVKREARDSDSSDGRIIGIYHIKKNPYTLLSSKDFGKWMPSYRVIHDEPDLNNVMGVPTRQRARYTLAINEVAGAPREVTEQVFGAEAAGSARPPRYFDQPKGKMQPRPERKFRKKGFPPLGQSVIEISHQPWNSEDDESEDTRQRLVVDMTIEDYRARRIAENASLVDGNLNEQKCILNTRVNTNPRDIQSWIELIRLQDRLTALNESGDPNAPVHNRQACAEVQLAMIKSAQEKNPHNIDLQMEKIKVLETLYGNHSEEVLREWRNTKNRYMNDLQMWRQYFKMLQSDRSQYSRQRYLKESNNCVQRLSGILAGTILSHEEQDGTAEFIVDHIVDRCKILIESGHVHDAVATVQALAEYHFFMPEEMELERVQHRRVEFAKFWNSGYPRIGDEGARGWKNTKSEYVAEDLEKFKEEEEKFLRKQREEMEAREIGESAVLRSNKVSNAQAWANLEKLRSSYLWAPIRFDDHPDDILDYPCLLVRMTEAEDDLIWHLLFTFPKKADNKNHAEILVYRILELLQAEIPGLDESVDATPQRVLQEISRNYFRVDDDSFAPVYEGVSEFLDAFFDLFGRGRGIETDRTLCARIGSVARRLRRMSLNANSKHKQVMVLSRDIDHNKFFLAYLADTLDIYEVDKNFEQGRNKEFASYSIRKAMLVIADNIWSRPVNERIAYLRLAVGLCTRLESVHQPKVEEEAREEPEADAEELEKLPNRRDFLAQLALTGNYKDEFDASRDNLIRAGRHYLNQIKTLKALTKAHQETWLGSEAYLLLKLAAYYFYEASAQRNIWSVHVSLSRTQYANSPEYAQVVAEVFAELFAQHCEMHPGEDVSRFRKFLEDSVVKHPRSVKLIRALAETSSSCSMRVFLGKHAVEDKTVQMIRHCGLVFSELRSAANVIGNITDALNMLRHTFEVACAAISEHGAPESILWRRWLRVENDAHTSPRRTENIFLLASAQCPWSKLLLMEGAHRQEDAFLNVVTSSEETYSLCLLCTPEEARIALTPSQEEMAARAAERMDEGDDADIYGGA